jgi:hypothetical protein
MPADSQAFLKEWKDQMIDGAYNFVEYVHILIPLIYKVLLSKFAMAQLSASDFYSPTNCNSSSISPLPAFAALG